MNSQILQTDKESWSNQALKHMLPFLDRCLKSKPSLSVSTLPQLVMNYLCRPGWPGAKASLSDRKQILLQLQNLAHSYSLESLEKAPAPFARQAITLVFSQLKPDAFESTFTPPSIANQCSQFIKQELKNSNCAKQAVLRAANALYQKRALHNSANHQPFTKLHAGLRNALNWPQHMSSPLPPQDLRLHFVKLLQKHQKEDKGFGNFLDKAALFSPQIMKAALGSHLYELARPVGYVGKSQQIVLLQTDSSVFAYEASFYKKEIIQRLRTIGGLHFIQDIRFVVKPL